MRPHLTGRNFYSLICISFWTYPSSHLSIHRVPAKLSNKGMPYRGNYCKLQLLFFFWFYWPTHSAEYGYSVDAPLVSFPLGFELMQYLSHSIVIWFLSKTRPDFRIIWNPARFWKKICSQSVLCRNCFLLSQTFDVRCHFLRVIDRPLLQNRIDASQKLAGYHDQWLHLFQRISLAEQSAPTSIRIFSGRRIVTGEVPVITRNSRSCSAGSVFWRAFFSIFVVMIPYNQRCIFMRFYRISIHYRKFKDAFAPLSRLKSLILRWCIDKGNQGMNE